MGLGALWGSGDRQGPGPEGAVSVQTQRDSAELRAWRMSLLGWVPGCTLVLQAVSSHSMLRMGLPDCTDISSFSTVNI